jgi:hypothetical protein
MSYDLMVWKSPQTADLDEFYGRLERFYENDDETAFDASDDVLRFYDDLMAAYPSLESYTDDEIDSVESWSMTPERSDRFITMNMTWSGSEKMGQHIARLAAKHGLMLHDPQGPHIFPPEGWEPEERISARLGLLAPIGALVIGMGMILAGLAGGVPGGWALIGLGIIFAAFAGLLLLPWLNRGKAA